MVLATKSKNIKDSLFVKIIVVLLALSMCAGFVNTGVQAFKYVYMFGDKAFTTASPVLQDCSNYEAIIVDDINSITSTAESNLKNEKAEKDKQDTKDLVFKRYKMAKGYYHKLLKGGYSYSEDDETPTQFPYEIDDGSEYYLDCDDGPLYNDDIRYNHNDIHFSIPLIYSDERAQKEINKTIDDYSAHFENSESMHLKNRKNLIYYAVAKDGTVVTNAETPEEFKKNIESNDVYYYSINGSDAVNHSLLSDDYNVESSLSELYLSLDTNYPEDDIYKKLNAVYQANKNIDFTKNLVMAFVFLAGILIMLIITCCFAGHKEGTVKTAWIDKVPNDIHFVVTAAMIAFITEVMAVVLIDGIGDNVLSATGTMPPMAVKWAYAGLYALFGVSYLLFAEWLTSVCRQVKAHSGYFKNTLVYKLFAYIKKAISKARQITIYKPENFMTRIIVAIVAYCSVSVFLFVLLCSALAAEVFALAFVIAIMLVAITAGGWIFAIKYIINLDKIITSAHDRTTPEVNYGKLPNSLKTLVDSITVNKDELNKAVDKAVRDEHMRTELITNVSHDLKTPLTSIINYVDLLGKCDIEDETAKEYINILEDKSGKLKHLIEDLIEASKATSGIIAINAVELNLNELVTQAIVEHQQEFTNNNLNLVFKGDAKNIIAYADGNKAYRVIENLLSNARKYSAKGSRVYADVYNEGNMAVFEIKNISAEPLDISPQELTERFVRGDKSRNKEGNGLGLSIADSFCIAMKGKLELSIDGDLFKARVLLPIK